MCDDDGEEAKEEHCSAGIHHRVEHSYRDGSGVGEVRHLLEKKKITHKWKSHSTLVIRDEWWIKSSRFSYLQHSIVAKQRAAHRGCAAVTVDQLTALLAPASLFLQCLQAPLGCHSISTRGQVAQRHPDGLRVVPHPAAVCHRRGRNYKTVLMT